MKANEVPVIQFKGWNCKLQISKYNEGGYPALRLIDKDTGELIAVATVNVPEVLEKFPGYVLIKNYSENAGILNTLIKAKVIEHTGVNIPSGYVTLHLCKLLIEE